MADKPVALVTGASSGIGEALCQELIEWGYRCVGVARREDSLAALQERYSSDEFIYFPCDVSSQDQVHAVSTTLKEQGWNPSLFFLNAGMAGRAVVEPSDEKFPLDHHRRVFDVNYFGVMHWVNEWMEPAIKSGSATFVATSSVNAFFAPPRGSAYSASKIAVARAFEGLDLQHHREGVRFCVVYPGPVKTAGLVGNWPGAWSAQRMAKYMVKRTLQGKVRSHSHWHYTVLCRMLRLLPYSWVYAFMKSGSRGSPSGRKTRTDFSGK